MLLKEKKLFFSMPQTSSLYLNRMKNYEHLNSQNEEWNFEKTQFLIFFENSNAHNFSPKQNRKMKFAALKRANVFLSITSI